MDKNQLTILKERLNYVPSGKVIDDLNKWLELFREYNSHTNLISKNDLKLIFEKHVFDSLCILKYPNFKPEENKTILDFGTGGGFPSVILSICFRNLKIIAVDSIGKKINFIELAKKELELENLHPMCTRIENLEPQGADLILSRAVGKVNDVYNLCQRHLKQTGKIILYKGKNVQDELAHFPHKKVSLIDYNLPTQEKHLRYLVVI